MRDLSCESKRPGKRTRIFGGVIVGVLAVIFCVVCFLRPLFQEDIFGAYYKQYSPESDLDKGVLYFLPQSITGEDDDNILEAGKAFYLTEEQELRVKELDHETGEITSWEPVGALEEIELTTSNFDDYFHYNGGNRPGYWFIGKYEIYAKKANYYRRNNWKAWRVIQEDRMYYVLQQRNGALYLAYGYYDAEGETDPYSDDSSIFSLMRIGEKDVETLEKILEDLWERYQRAGYFQEAETDDSPEQEKEHKKSP